MDLPTFHIPTLIGQLIIMGFCSRLTIINSNVDFSLDSKLGLAGVWGDFATHYMSKHPISMVTPNLCFTEIRVDMNKYDLYKLSLSRLVYGLVES